MNRNTVFAVAALMMIGQTTAQAASTANNPLVNGAKGNGVYSYNPGAYSYTPGAYNYSPGTYNYTPGAYNSTPAVRNSQINKAMNMVSQQAGANAYAQAAQASISQAMSSMKKR